MLQEVQSPTSVYTHTHIKGKSKREWLSKEYPIAEFLTRTVVGRLNLLLNLRNALRPRVTFLLNRILMVMFDLTVESADCETS